MFLGDRLEKGTSLAALKEDTSTLTKDSSYKIAAVASSRKLRAGSMVASDSTPSHLSACSASFAFCTSSSFSPLILVSSLGCWRSERDSRLFRQGLPALKSRELAWHRVWKTRLSSSSEESEQLPAAVTSARLYNFLRRRRKRRRRGKRRRRPGTSSSVQPRAAAGV